MKTHHLNSHLQPFHDVACGIKKSEIRIDDRNFEVGDLIVLCEFESGRTGNFIEIQICHIQRGYGLKDGYVALSFEILP